MSGESLLRELIAGCLSVLSFTSTTISRTRDSGTGMKRSRGLVRKFTTGATRDTDQGKFDYEAFLSPLVLQRFAEYLHKHRLQSDGKLRAGDNWQQGIPKDVYIKSACRHFIDWWAGHRAGVAREEAMTALMFNVMGYLFEVLKERKYAKVNPHHSATRRRRSR